MNNPEKLKKHTDYSAIVAFAENRLSPEHRLQVNTHLKSCVHCQFRLDEIRAEASMQVEAIPDEVIKAWIVPEKSPKSIDVPFEKVTQPTKRAASTLIQTEIPTELTNNASYNVIRELARGGVGVLYLVEHRITGRQEALKVINPTLAGRADVRERFIREIQAAAKLNHPNIVRTLSAMQEGSLLGMVMEFVPGLTLKQYVRKWGPLGWKQAIDFAIQAAQGLNHAYEQGVIHRDIKPSNLIVSEDGNQKQVRILDFGLVRSISDVEKMSDMTVDGRILGTLNFMAPEQALNASKADIRSDIYGLGCTLYFLLTGSSPYDEESAIATLNAHQNAPIPDLSECRSDLPVAVQIVFDRMMAKKSIERYQTPMQLINDLESLLHTAPAAAVATIPSSQKTSRSALAKRTANVSTKASPIPSNLLDLNKPSAKPRKKTMSVWTIAPWIFPPLLLSILAYNYPPEQWAHMLGLSPERSSTIAIGTIPEGVQVFIDGFPAKFTRSQADSIPEIEAKPGTYRLTFQYLGNPILETSVEVLPNTRRILELDIRTAIQKAKREPGLANSIASESDANDPASQIPAPQNGNVPQNRVQVNSVHFQIQQAITHLKDRNFERFHEYTQRLPVSVGDESIDSRLNACREASDMIRQYFDSIRANMQSRTSGESLEIANGSEVDLMPYSDINPGESIGVVESNADKIIFRIRGVNRTYAYDELPASLSISMLRLGSNVPLTKMLLFEMLGIIVSNATTIQEKQEARNKLSDAHQKRQLTFDVASMLQPLVDNSPRISESVTPMRGGADLSFSDDATELIPVESDAKPWKFEREMLGHSGPIFKACFLPDGRLASCQKNSSNGAVLATNRSQYKLILWQPKTGMFTSPEIKLNSMIDFDFSPNGKLLSVVGQNSSGAAELQIWSGKATTPYFVFSKFATLEPNVCFSFDNAHVAAIDGLGTFRRWSIQSLAVAGSTAVLPIPTSELTATAVSSRLDIIAQARLDGVISIWSSKDGKSLRSIPGSGESKSGNSRAISLLFSRDSKRLAAFREDGNYEMYDTETADWKSSRAVTNALMKFAGVSSNQSYAILADYENELTLFSLEKFHCLARWKDADRSQISSIAVNETGTMIAVCFESGKIRIWSKP
ncbi:MAG: protein kinase [Pirellulaceae bacterium]|nr:protein kinase [Pirellulaceae bacterium]